MDTYSKEGTSSSPSPSLRSLLGYFILLEEKPWLLHATRSPLLLQPQTFEVWVNHNLAKRGMVINDLATDFSDGVKLIHLLEILSDKVVGKYKTTTTSRFVKIENVNIALQFILTVLKVPLYSLGAEGNRSSLYKNNLPYHRYCGWKYKNHSGSGLALDTDIQNISRS